MVLINVTPIKPAPMRPDLAGELGLGTAPKQVSAQLAADKARANNLLQKILDKQFVSVFGAVK
jgi:hypothetical protein